MDNLEQGRITEWTMDNGTGAYACGSIIASENKVSDGYLVSKLRDFGERYVVLEQIQEWFSVGGKEYDLENSAHRNDGETVLREGNKFLKKVSCDGAVSFEYEITTDSGSLVFTKSISLVKGERSVAIAYTIHNNSSDGGVIILTPQFCFRDASSISEGEKAGFDLLLTGDTLSMVPISKPDVRIDFSISEGTYYELVNKDDLNRELEAAGGRKVLIASFVPFEISIDLEAQSTKYISCVCSLIQVDSDLMEATQKEEEEYREILNEFFSEATGRQFDITGALPESETTPDGEWSRKKRQFMLEQASDKFVGPRTAHKLIEKSKELTKKGE